MIESGRVQAWNKIRAKLKKEFQEKGITRCEMCGSDNFLSFAHRKKRGGYYNRDRKEEEKQLGDFNEVLLLCIQCHEKIEDNKTLTEEVFHRLRSI